MSWTYTKTYFLKNTTNNNIFPQNFISFFKTPKLTLKNSEFNKKHTKILTVNINKKIEHSFFTYKKNSGHLQTTITPVWLGKESYRHFLPIIFTIKKAIIIIKTGQKKQNLFFFKEIINTLNITTKVLYKETTCLKAILLENKDYFSKEKHFYTLFYKNYCSNYFFNTKIISPQKFYFQSTISNSVLAIIIITYYNLFITKKLTFVNYNIIQAKSKLFKENTLNKKKYLNTVRHAKLISILNGRANIKTNCIKKIKYHSNPNIFIWKPTNKRLTKVIGASTIKKNYFPIIKNKNFNFDTTTLVIRTKNKYKITPSILYLLLRLEEKIDFYTKNNKTTPFAHEILKLYNVLQTRIVQKQNFNSSTGVILTNLIEILKIKNMDWKFLSLHAINAWVQNTTHNSPQKTQKFFTTLWNKIDFIDAKVLTKKSSEIIRPQIQHKINLKTNILAPISKQKNYHAPLNVKKFLVNEKFVLKNTKYNFKNNKDILRRMTQRKIKIFFINALSLTKFAFNLERILDKKEKRSPTLFLQNIDRDLINKYKYIAIYIKDLIRICFIGMYLKKANFIAQFIAFQLGKLPRNRKETSFIRFIIKVVKTFAAEREEILGLRIKFSGRVNRWRRTKAIIGERGVIPLHTIQNQIEYGTAHAINRKGAVGIKIWIHYKPTFNTILKESILKYFKYSKRLILKKKTVQTALFLK